MDRLPELRKSKRTAAVRRPRNCRGSAYVLVLGTAMVVTTIGMSALLIMRVHTHTANASRDEIKARFYGQSVVDIVLFRIANDANWRTTYTNDTWTGREKIRELRFRYKLVDEEDGDLADDVYQPARLYAEATVGAAVRIYSVLLNPGSSGFEQAETELMKYISSADLKDYEVKHDKWCGQYFKPTLPAEATSWRVTRVRFRALADKAPLDELTKVQLRPPTAGNLPSATVLGEVLLDESTLTGSFEWREVIFANVSGLSPSEGLCLVFETDSPDGSCRIEYQDAHVVLPDAGFVEYSGSWQLDANQALQFYVYGTVSEGERAAVIPVAGTWRQEILP